MTTADRPHTLDEIEAFTRALMADHGLHDWEFRWDRAKERFGACWYRRRWITLSRHLTPQCELEEIHDTILHEIAHALAGPHAKHGPRWKAIARELGAHPSATAAHPARVAPRYVGTCPNCLRTVRAHRRGNLACGVCSATYQPAYRLRWTEVPAVNSSVN